MGARPLSLLLLALVTSAFPLADSITTSSCRGFSEFPEENAACRLLITKASCLKGVREATPTFGGIQNSCRWREELTDGVRETEVVHSRGISYRSSAYDGFKLGLDDCEISFRINIPPTGTRWHAVANINPSNHFLVKAGLPTANCVMGGNGAPSFCRTRLSLPEKYVGDPRFSTVYMTYDFLTMDAALARQWNKTLQMDWMAITVEATTSKVCRPYSNDGSSGGNPSWRVADGPRYLGRSNRVSSLAVRANRVLFFGSAFHPWLGPTHGAFKFKSFEASVLSNMTGAYWEVAVMGALGGNPQSRSSSSSSTEAELAVNLLDEEQFKAYTNYLKSGFCEFCPSPAEYAMRGVRSCTGWKCKGRVGSLNPANKYYLFVSGPKVLAPTVSESFEPIKAPFEPQHVSISVWAADWAF